MRAGRIHGAPLLTLHGLGCSSPVARLGTRRPSCRVTERRHDPFAGVMEHDRAEPAQLVGAQETADATKTLRVDRGDWLGSSARRGRSKAERVTRHGAPHAQDV